MKLSDVVSNAGLAFYAEVALVIFFAVFVGVALWTFSRRQEHVARMSRIPLEDSPVVPRITPSSAGVDP